MKIIITFILALAAPSLRAQETQILKLLNRALKKEVQHLSKNETYTWGDTRDSLAVVQPFSISKDKILSVEVSKKVYNGTETTRQEVPLHKIESIFKDINVIFVTTNRDVKVTTTNVYNDGTAPKTTTYNYDLFFLSLSSGLQNESWQDAVARAFSKAGLHIEKEVWAD